MLGMLRRRNIEVTVLTANAADPTFVSDIKNLGITTFGVPHRRVGFSKYPDLNIERRSELIKSSHVVWITDNEYLCAPRIKRIERDKPVIAHITSNALACPVSTNASYGMSETCTENCSHSLRRFARCKQLSKQYLRRWHLNSRRMRFYQVLNFPKSCVDFMNWPLIRRNENVFESIDCFVALSEFTRDLMRIHLPQLKNVPIEVVPNPVSMPGQIGRIQHEERSEKSILYASGPNIMKGPHIALYATRKLLDNSSKTLKLTMLAVQGNAWITNLIKRLQIEKHVRLLSRLPRTEVGALMARNDLVLLPSITPEPFPRVPIEANLVGTPAIVSNQGALPSLIVDKVTGLVAEPSVEAFVKAVEVALATNWNSELIAQTAKTRFDPERITDMLVSTLESFA
jgi:glycosyltransferase involved in cell wall biosynthesis